MIYTTGAFIVPKMIDDHWVWIVAEFNDDTFSDGEPLDNIKEYGSNKSQLFGCNKEIDGCHDLNEGRKCNLHYICEICDETHIKKDEDVYDNTGEDFEKYD